MSELLFDVDNIATEDYLSDIELQDTIELIKRNIYKLNNLPLSKKVDSLNQIKEFMHEISPFKTEPVDLIKWVPVEDVVSNDYNPNSVAPPEMELLRHSINNDGYTQPVVTWMSDEKDSREVIDGFHRSRVCREFSDVNERVKGYLPVVTMRDDNIDKNNRIAATIRHNRARGKHKVESMSDIVVDLKKRNWTDNKICKELGMDPDEVLRLCQVSGLVEMFAEQDFTNSWEVDVYDDQEAIEDIESE